jgi:uncharacterized protein
VSSPNEILMIFTRYPEPGRVKTRLIPTLGAQAAAGLSCRLTKDTLARAQMLASQRTVALEVWFDGGDEGGLAECFGSARCYRRQTGGDLGERMLRAFQSALTTPDRRALLIGTDCPDLSPDLMRTAFEALSSCDLVLGPARDGGYYLIGLRRAIPELFRGIAWGTSTVRAETLTIAHDLALLVEELPVLEDVDRPEDLPHLAPALGFTPHELARRAPQS